MIVPLGIMYKPLNNNNNPSTHKPNQSQSQSQSQSHYQLVYINKIINYQFMDLIHGLVFTKNDINIIRKQLIKNKKESNVLSTTNPPTNQQSIQQLINTNQSLSLNTSNNKNNLSINNIS
eukprot:422565_1